MIGDAEENRWVQAITLGLAMLATASAELAIAEPGRPPGLSLAWAALWSAIAVVSYEGMRQLAFARGPVADTQFTARRHRTRASARPLVTISILVVFALPLAIEAARLAIWGRAEAMEIVLLSALRNLVLGLAVLASRPAFTRLAAFASLFLILVSTSLADGPIAIVIVSVYAAVGGLWLVLTYWRGLQIVIVADGQRRFPLASLLLATGLVGLVVLIAAMGPARVATALVGLVPSSGGTSWDNPDARGGVNDGENEAKGSEKPQSIGFADTDVYLDSDRPSLYDAFNDTYGEPIRPKQQNRMVSIGNQNVAEQRERPAENLRAGQEFSTVRRGKDTANRRPSDREAKALLYVKGQTPLHLGLVAYNRFDGRGWQEEPLCAADCPLVLQPDGAPWFRINVPSHSHYAGTVAHQIKIGTLDSSPLPVPAHLSRFRIGQVNRRDFFGWSHEGMMRMIGRTVPSSTVIESEARVADPARLRKLWFSPNAHASSRLLTVSDGHRITPEIAALARSWSDGIPRGWAQVEAVVSTLRHHATHDRGTTLPADCQDVVAHFLLQSRRGPDYTFATAAAVLLRSLDYPTRLVSGFYAAPERYDPRTQHTAVIEDDVHFWAEVRLPDGTWITIEPTPGYELMTPSPPWYEIILTTIASATYWARSNAVLLCVVFASLAALICFRRNIEDSLATIAWRLSTPVDTRLYAIAALSLVERRSSWANLPRPMGRSPRRWYEKMIPPTNVEIDDLGRLIHLAEWGLYAPLGAALPKQVGDDDPRDTCRRAVDAWTVRRFKKFDRLSTSKELVI